ncbi:ParM/StbA family protein [Thiohalocapsa marina]|uniref:ParM/StbA family protein n=1 Tax=Thiohalocapsa marina TaxID=424902 RepID=A0A5M8FH39_9GAMM|nr:ParM/StbA family protein [Thiohalocapsa marina]KAA6183734.1 ParM/StbA family protein [Thiohalocapsa marina]
MFVVGLDIGYSNLKLAAGACGSTPRTQVLPAVAAPQLHVAQRLESGNSRSPDGIAVSVHGQHWIAGVAPARVSGWQRALHEDYVTSDTYQALLLAALQVIGAQRIDRLVTGLPVAQAMEPAQRERLRARLQGRHALTDGAVEIAEVRVIAQPVGAFVELLMRADAPTLERIGAGTVLVIDVGFFSVDWAVLVNGDLRRTASGTSLEAMSVLIDAAAERLRGQRAGKAPVAAIEQALAQGRPAILLHGDWVALAPYLQLAAREVGAVALEALRRDLRHEQTNVDLLLLTGGGAALFEPAVRRVFPAVPLQLPPDPVGANARGYFHYGCR